MGTVQACKTNQAWDQSLCSILLIHWLSYGFEVYTGKENVNGSPKAVVLCQMDQAGVVGSSGRILYTDNSYTSEDVMEEVWKKYKMLMVV